MKSRSNHFGKINRRDFLVKSISAIAVVYIIPNIIETSIAAKQKKMTI